MYYGNPTTALVEVKRDKVRYFNIPRESLLIDSRWKIYKLK